MLRSVLLIDDTPTFLGMVTRFLEAEGQDEVRVVGSVVGGQDAVAQATRLKPDVILLDLAMPGVCGLDLLPPLRRTLPEAILVALTVLDPEEFRERAIAAGADAFVSKASLEHDLLPAIRHAASCGQRRGSGG